MTEVPLPARGRVRHPAERFGTSLEGRPLEVYGPRDGGGLVVGAIHGNESETLVALSAALRMLPVGALRFAVVLTANPDGVLLGTRGNAAGVDLNRNFPASDWEETTVRSHWSSGTGQVVELSTGTAAASEPETRALMGLVESMAPRWLLSVHAPIGVVLEATASPLGEWLVGATGLERIPKVKYHTPGLLDRWALERDVVPVTLELPRVTHDEAVVRFAPVLAALLRGEADGVA